ncbi:MAG: NUDIX domain-containing protein [Patescibacteria group bacterium]
MEPTKQRLKAMCVFNYEGKTLASRGYDKNKDETFYRLIGGTILFQEKSEDGVRREIMEELKCEIDSLEFIKVVENIFSYIGENRHEIVFLYKGELSNKDLYKQEKIHIIEPNIEFDAEWISVKDVLEGKIILYPDLDYSGILK